LGSINLEKVMLTPLSCISTYGGNVLHAMRHDDDGYKGFGESYFSWINAGVVKAWKRHNLMTMNLIVPVGNVKFVFATDEGDDFRVEVVGVDRYMRITVPPGIWFGFQGLSDPQSLVMNIANIEHHPDEVDRLDKSKFKFNWS
jgi:dTDP-4-dehydrorhamnose 3,5-epimerase